MARYRALSQTREGPVNRSTLDFRRAWVAIVTQASPHKATHEEALVCIDVKYIDENGRNSGYFVGQCSSYAVIYLLKSMSYLHLFIKN